PPDELAARDGLQPITSTEIRPGEAIYLGDVTRGDVADCGPQLRDALARQPIDHPCSLAPATQQPRPSQGAQMMRSVRDALIDLPRDVLDRALPLRQQVDDLDAPTLESAFVTAANPSYRASFAAREP